MAPYPYSEEGAREHITYEFKDQPFGSGEVFEAVVKEVARRCKEVVEGSLR